jgi:peroxiredoxin
VKKIFIILFLVLFSSYLSGSNIDVNKNFPVFKLTTAYLSSKEKKYLGINNKFFKISDIKSTYIFVEFLNIYCFACQKQAPLYNKLYNKLKCSDIKFIGIALGNSFHEVESFKKAHNITFPIIPDPGFKIYKLIGGTRTPFTVIIKNKKIIFTHLGLNKNITQLVENFRNNSLTAKAEGKENFEKIKISEREVFLKVKQVIKNIKIFEKHKYFYKIFTNNNKVYYAVAISSKSVCNICHPMSFIYIVNEKAIITGFIPIHLTKKRNKPWNSKDIEKIKKYFIGRSIFSNFKFNKKIDTVTSATITTSMIFYYLNNGKNILK